MFFFDPMEDIIIVARSVSITVTVLDVPIGGFCWNQPFFSFLEHCRQCEHFHAVWMNICIQYKHLPDSMAGSSPLRRPFCRWPCLCTPAQDWWKKIFPWQCFLKFPRFFRKAASVSVLNPPRTIRCRKTTIYKAIRQFNMLHKSLKFINHLKWINI